MEYGAFCFQNRTFSKVIKITLKDVNNTFFERLARVIKK